MKVVSPPLRLTNASRSSNVQGIVFTREFRQPPCSLSLRPFNVFSDLPVIYNRSKVQDNFSELIVASYFYSRESSFARSYIVLLDHHLPLCEVDISCALQDELCNYFKAEAGDHIIRIIPASTRRPGRRLFSELLETCLSYFFQFREVIRLFIESEAENNWQHDPFEKTGFRFREMICHEYKYTCLYQYSPALGQRNH